MNANGGAKLAPPLGVWRTAVVGWRLVGRALPYFLARPVLCELDQVLRFASRVGNPENLAKGARFQRVRDPHLAG